MDQRYQTDFQAKTNKIILPLLFSMSLIFVYTPLSAAPIFPKKSTWPETLLTARKAFKKLDINAGKTANLIRDFQKQLSHDFPVQWDWILQDAGNDFSNWFTTSQPAAIEINMIKNVLKEPGIGKDLLSRFKALKTSSSIKHLLEFYDKTCTIRRKLRLKKLLDKKLKIVFTRHRNLGGSHYAYTEAQSDAQRERHFMPGASLCVLEMNSLFGTIRTLVDDPHGMIRDPNISYDGKRILFSWKKSDRQDDFHLYEFIVKSGRIRQLTSGLGFADYEGAYLPSGDIIFNSTRCVQIVDCWWTEVSNLYTCNKDGKFLRRLTFDQVHTNFPSVLKSGKIIYTRWDYNDRGQVFPQALYQMNPDGTNQSEFYGNNSWFPTTILHARGIPGTEKVIGVAMGHHTRQAGKLILIDPSKGSEENSGATLIAPVRDTKAPHIDQYGQQGELFQYPYALNENEYLVTYSPTGWSRRPVIFNIYYMTIDGRRELLASDPEISCNQSVPLMPRPIPHLKPSMVNYRKKTGTYYIQDIYKGQGLKGIQRGTIKQLRVVELRFRAAGIGSNGNRGPAGGAMVSTPIAIDNGSWDVKAVLGNAKIYDDGSACFNVPAMKPVYFQAIDEKGHAVQSMRTWSTLQPGEYLSCVGCHEKKNETPITIVKGHSKLTTHLAQLFKETIAMKKGAQDLKPFYGPPRGFSFSREIQPILDRRCIQCHNDRTKEPYKSSKSITKSIAGKSKAKKPIPTFSLLDTPNRDQRAGRAWSDSYLILTSRGNPSKGPVRWLNVQSVPPVLPPYFAGSAKSPLITMLEQGHYDVKLSREELDKISCWIDLLVPFSGDYIEGNCWNENQLKKYLHFKTKRDRMTALIEGNINQLLAGGTSQDSIPTPGITTPMPNPYRNIALNPDDVQGYARSFPHASSNSEYHNMKAFAALNVINGKTSNTGHGGRFPSWGPDKKKGLWCKIDFGRQVETDKVILYIRADFPHDDFWHTATIEFSDGSKETIKIKKTAEPQEFTFKGRIISWLRFSDLIEAEPLGWCGFTEVQVWGRDLYSPLILAEASE